MAFSLALKRSTASNLLNRLINPIRSAYCTPPLVSRSFATQMSRFSDDEDDDGTDTDQLFSRTIDFAPRVYAGVIDPISSFSQVLPLMDAGRGRSAWDIREDDESVSIRVDMPGLARDDVKISVDGDTLIIKGECPKEEDGDEEGKKYSSRIDLPKDQFKVDEIKAEMKNGVLRVRVPKVKDEDRKGVFQVKID